MGTNPKSGETDSKLVSKFSKIGERGDTITTYID